MPSVDPITWKSLDLSDPVQMNVFKQQLPQYLNESMAPANLASQLSGSAGGVSGSAINTKQFTLTAVSTNQTVNCANALNVSITMTFTAALTLTLNNLAIGATVTMDIDNTSGASKTLTIAATTPAGVAYVVIKANVAAATKNWLAGAGVPATTEFIMNGQTTTGPNLVMVGN